MGHRKNPRIVRALRTAVFLIPIARCPLPNAQCPNFLYSQIYILSINDVELFSCIFSFTAVISIARYLD
ncbi:hypothetical protein PI95_024945 [Hassallia byssoidea VB512170]|uniref:Uncharacterized protein n=1 Tax=Hassallia byssoidea VB512170 TaxID=1304833 RepID=A0A846HEI1_9CYAN|nr:hypothetical protein [Hassalia byssoidea VB512170]